MEKVLITGATSGIGLATAKCLVEAGFEVIATHRLSSDVSKLQAIALENTNLHLACFDVLDALYYPLVLQNLKDQYDGFDIVIMNAGVLYAGLIEDMTPQQILTTVQTNLSACMAMTSLLVEDMKAKQNGQLIFLSSLAAIRPLPNLAVYNASKAGIEAFAKSLYLELASSHISVYLIEPGYLETNLWANQHTIFDNASKKSKKFLNFKQSSGNVEEVSFQILKICQNKTNKLHHKFGFLAKMQCLCKPFIYTKMGQKVYIYLSEHIK